MLSQFLLKSFVKNFNSTQDEKVRKNYALLEGWLSVILNIALSVAKLLVGIVSGSLALIADAAHSFSDVLSSLVVMISSYFASRPGDKAHPFGHGRSDYVGSLFVAFLLGLTGYEFLISSIKGLFKTKELHIDWVLIAVLIFSVVLKEWMARFSFYLAKKIDSPLLKAEGSHHRSDAFSSIVVLIGMSAAYFGLPILDSIVGIFLALLILYSGYEVAIEGISFLLGKAPGEKEIQQIVHTAASVSHVEGVHDIIVHHYGRKTIISLHVEVCNRLPLTKAHEVAEKVEEKLSKELGYFSTVHIDPLDLHDPFIVEIIQYIKQSLPNINSSLRNFHDVRVEDINNKKTLLLDLSISKNLSATEEEQIIKNFKELLKNKFDSINEVSIQIEPLFSY